MVVVNTFLYDSWSIGKRDSATHFCSARLPNMTARLAENKRKIDAKITSKLMDLNLYDADGSIAANNGCTKPINQNEDITVHQVVTDIKNRQM